MITLSVCVGVHCCSIISPTPNMLSLVERLLDVTTTQGAMPPSSFNPRDTPALKTMQLHCLGMRVSSVCIHTALTAGSATSITAYSTVGGSRASSPVSKLPVFIAHRTYQLIRRVIELYAYLLKDKTKHDLTSYHTHYITHFD